MFELSFKIGAVMYLHKLLDIFTGSKNMNNFRDRDQCKEHGQCGHGQHHALTSSTFCKEQTKANRFTVCH